MRVEKTWGYEEIVFNGTYCCKKLVYTRPIASSLHYHERKHETFVIASGRFELEVNELDPRTMVQCDHVVLPPGTLHRIRCVEPGTIIEASTHDDPADCVRLTLSET